jgi:HD-GYP domain-containing protein (c-di-GMP phosphodiesterase class II)
LDQQLADLLAEQLGHDVSLHMAESDGPRGLIGRAVGTPGEAQVEHRAEYSLAALLLPGGSVAVWQTTTADVQRSARHAQNVLALEMSRVDNQQLRAEVDSLVAQVTNDFEELSLIRSLSCSIALPNMAAGGDDIVKSTLLPLATGLGAEAIAAVFVDENEELLEPTWSGEPLIPAAAMHLLIQTHRAEAQTQPVIENHFRDSEIYNLREFILVECRSEQRVHGWLLAGNRIDNPVEDVPWAQFGFTTVQASLMETTTNQLAAYLHNLRLLRQKEDLFTDVVRALVNAVDARDPYTCGHSERVALFARCLAAVSGQDAATCERIYLSGLLHDVGKIAVPDDVLQKPARLTDEERAIIEKHPESGWRILHQLEAMRGVLVGVLYHHENFDGTGYPDQLAGANIPIDGRILAVCDAFDAMTSNRPYRQGMSVAKACEILRGGAGTYWDPQLVEVFLDHIDQFDAIRLGHQPREQAIRQAPVSGLPMLSAVSTPVAP